MVSGIGISISAIAALVVSAEMYVEPRNLEPGLLTSPPQLGIVKDGATLLLAQSSSSTPRPTATPAPTPTPAPSATPAPTRTPKPDAEPPRPRRSVQ